MASAQPQSSGSISSKSIPERPQGVDVETRLLETLTTLPIITKATLQPSSAAASGVQLTVTVAQSNLAANKKRQLSYTVHVPDAAHPGADAFVTGTPVELRDQSLVSVSPSGSRSLIAKTNGDGAVVLELWSKHRLVKELTVPKTQHGPVFNDGWFSKGAAWNADESKVAYVAEAPQALRTPLWSGQDVKDAAVQKGWRGLGECVEDDWGELNTDKRTPRVFVLDVATASVAQVTALPDDHTLGQPAWCPDGSSLVVVAWPHQPANFAHIARRLGIVFCFNRPSFLYHVPCPAVVAAGVAATAADSSTEGDGAAGEQQPATRGSGSLAAATSATKLSGDLLSASAPLFTPAGDRLIFLSHQAAASSGVHAATVSMYSIPWPPSKASPISAPNPIIETIQRPNQHNGFPGLYGASFVDAPFIDNHTLLITSQWRSKTVILAVDTVSGTVSPVTDTDATTGSWTLQGIKNGVAAAIVSKPNALPQLMLAPTSQHASGSGRDAGRPWDWSAVAGLRLDLQQELPEAAAAVGGVETRVLIVEPTVGPKEFRFEALVQAPKSRKGPCPTVVFPHGGPHTAIAANYYMPFALLTSLGYCVVAVNYRGSTGFGEAALQSLPGHVGSHDVEDCMAALDAAVAAGYADPQRVAVVGGSHGGFLGGHLVGQHPDRFKCGVLRNPVLNISLMVHTTDIPDWCYIETFGTEEGRRRFTTVPTPDDLRAFFETSPIAHVDHVTVPLAFLLGSKDRRVPLNDGKRYVDALRSRGLKTRTLVFPEDTHALDKPQTEFEQWLNIVDWLKQHV